MAKTRATRAEQGSSILGKDILLFLNYGENASEETPVWALIGGQRSADYNSSAEEIDTTDKTSDGYGDSEPGLKTAELTTEVIVKKGDETIGALQEAYETSEPVDILRYVEGGRSIRNWYTITNMENSAPHDDACVLSLTMKGKGKPTYIENMENPNKTA